MFEDQREGRLLRFARNDEKRMEGKMMKKVRYLGVFLIILLSSLFSLLSFVSPARGDGVDVGEKIELEEEELRTQMVAILQGFLRHSDKDVKLWAIKALGKIGEIDEDEMNILIILLPMLREKDPEIKSAVKEALNEIIGEEKSGGG